MKKGGAGGGGVRTTFLCTSAQALCQIYQCCKNPLWEFDQDLIFTTWCFCETRLFHLFGCFGHWVLLGLLGLRSVIELGFPSLSEEGIWWWSFRDLRFKDCTLSLSGRSFDIQEDGF